MKKLIITILILLLPISASFPCSAGIEFLITISPQFVDLAFFNEFAMFSQKVDDMAYGIINRNKNSALDKYEKAYTILFNIYKTYYKNPPPFYSDLKDFQSKMDQLTTLFTSFKEMIENVMFATASEKLKKYVKFTNDFINPDNNWTPVQEKRQDVLSELHREDLLYALQSIINNFITTKSDLKTKLKLGEIKLPDNTVIDRKVLADFEYTIIPELKPFMTFETAPVAFTDLIIEDDLRNTLGKDTDYMIFGELLTAESVYLEFKDTKKNLVKIETSDQAFFRYKIISLKNLAIEVIDESKIGIKIDTLYDQDKKKALSKHKLSYSMPLLKFDADFKPCGIEHKH